MNATQAARVEGRHDVRTASGPRCNPSLRSRCPAFVLAGLLASACGEVEHYPEEKRRVVVGAVGKVQVAVELSRSGTHYPFGKGEGRHGFISPAYDDFKIYGWIDLRRADGTELLSMADDRYVKDALLLRWTRQTGEGGDARQLWNERWSELVIEPCDFADGRRFGVRAATRSRGSEGWRVVVVKGDRWVETEDPSGQSCDEIRGRPRAAK